MHIISMVCLASGSLLLCSCHERDGSSAPAEQSAKAPPSAALPADTAASSARLPAGADVPPAKPTSAVPNAPLRIAYSDWPGWVAWQVAIEEHYFEQAGLDVQFSWLEYVPSIEAFSEGKVDAVCMTNGDALVAGSSGAQSVGIVINDYSNGNDMIVARPGIDTPAMLRGKRIGAEIGFVDHLLLMEALQSAGLNEKDVTIVNAKTHETPELLGSGAVDAIAAWQPHSGHALSALKGAKAVFTSADVPGLIYDLLFVSRASLAARRADWLKVVQTWFRVVDFIADPARRPEAIRIMAQRVALPPERLAELMGGTRLLGREDNRRRFRAEPGFESVQGSSEAVDRFNVANRVYKDRVAVGSYFDATLVDEALAAARSARAQ